MIYNMTIYVTNFLNILQIYFNLCTRKERSIFKNIFQLNM